MKPFGFFNSNTGQCFGIGSLKIKVANRHIEISMGIAPISQRAFCPSVGNDNFIGSDILIHRSMITCLGIVSDC